MGEKYKTLSLINCRSQQACQRSGFEIINDVGVQGESLVEAGIFSDFC